jgi:large subunit ribosomal protein L18
MKQKFASEKTRKRSARRRRVRTGLGTTNRTRLTVFRSAKHIYAQLVSPDGRTITSVSTRAYKDGPTGNIEAAKRVGSDIAKAAKEHSIDRVVFNRNGFLYHGRVKALADAAREAGLQF